MIGTGQSMWQLAGTTAAIGMGVVFVALFLLSVYMHYFKVLIGRFEGRHQAKPQKPQRKPAPAAPKLKPAPDAEEAEPANDAGAQVAAAVAVGLRLNGLGGAPGSDVAAAVAAALAIHRGRVQTALRPAGRTMAPWPMAGRLEMMGGRVRRQER